jgi:hypothetical protein
MESNLDLNSLQKEVLVSSDTSGQFWNVCVWDYNSGSSLQTYKNSSAVPHGLEFVKADYLLLAAYNKPYIVCWNLKGKVNLFFFFCLVLNTILLLFTFRLFLVSIN